MTEDSELLRDYADEKSEAAFTTFVERHIGFVYSTALRRVHGNTALAEDVTQDVFVAVARKCRLLVQQSNLVGWLYLAAQVAAANRLRTELRRQRREQEAYAMQDSNARPLDWERLRPVIDEALNELGDTDRETVLLRFFEGATFTAIAAKLSLTEDAARMRLNRALDKLSGLLAKRGLVSSGSALALALGNQVAGAAGGQLTASVVKAAMTSSTATGLTFIAMTKLQTGIILTVAALGTATLLREVRANRVLATEITTLQRQSQDAAPAQLPLKAASSKRPVAADEPAVAELSRLRARAASLRARPGWVVEADMKPATAARNAGWQTAQQALETFLWAKTSGNTAALVENFKWFGEAKTQADAAFAQLSAAVRARYGSADRLAGEVAFGRSVVNADYKLDRNGGFLIEPNVAPTDAVAGYWPSVDPEAELARSGILLRTRNWIQLTSGMEKALVIDLAFTGSEWTVGTNRFSAAAWQKIVDQLDPQTGERLGSSGQK